MKRLISLLPILLFGTSLYFANAAVKSIENKNVLKRFVNRIEGIVWSPDHQPVSDVYVELQNENGMSLRRVRTTANGRFSFTVNGQGNFIIKVLTTGTIYLEHSESVELVQVTQYSSDSQYLDVNLQIDKRKATVGISGITDAIFVQEVPEEARKLYKSGLKKIDENNIKGFDDMEQALKIFPDYYDPLNKIGLHYTETKEYEKSLPYLIHSIDINQRSYSSFYALAFACLQLNHLPEASEAARGATMLQANSLNAQLLYGTILRMNGDYTRSEKALLAAKAIDKDSSMPQIHMQLALLYEKLNRNKEAADELEIYLKLQPKTANKKDIQDEIAKLRKDNK